MTSRTIVLTGATSGLVRRAAVQLADAGHRLVLIGRSPARAASLAGELPDAHVVVADLSSPASYDRNAAQRLWSVTESLRGPFGREPHTVSDKNETDAS